MKHETMDYLLQGMIRVFGLDTVKQAIDRIEDNDSTHARQSRECRGSFVLNSACGQCKKCELEKQRMSKDEQ